MAVKKSDTKNLISGNVTKVLYWGSIISLVLILFASMKHVQVMYLSIETDAVQNSEEIAYAPWSQAISMEVLLVIAALILALKRRKKEKPEKIYTFGIYSVTFLNFVGNMYAAMVAHADIETVKNILTDDRFHVFKLLLTSGTIPLFALMLMEYISFFYVLRKSEEVAEKVQLEKERKKEESRILKEKRLAYREQVNAKVRGVDLELDNNSKEVEEEQTPVAKKQKEIKPQKKKVEVKQRKIQVDPELEWTPDEEPVPDVPFEEPSLDSSTETEKKKEDLSPNQNLNIKPTSGNNEDDELEIDVFGTGKQRLRLPVIQ